MLDPDKNRLLDAKKQVERFLSERLFLKLHPGKVYLQPAKYGVPFVGAWIKRDHVYPGPRLVHHYRNFRHRTVMQHQDENWARSNASYEGQLVNYDGII